MSAAFQPRTPGRPPGQGRVVVIMPARNSALTLEATVRGIPPGLVDQIVLVDNASKDDTVAIAERLGLTVVRHPVDRGFGGSVKRLFHEALAAGADFVIELHPDNQYDPSGIPALLDEMGNHRHAMVIASRFLPARRALDGGMPWWKFTANRFLTFMNNAMMGVWLSEYHSGFRIYSARLGAHGPMDVVLGRLQAGLPADLAGRHRRLDAGRGAGLLPLLRRGLAKPVSRVGRVRLGHADRILPGLEVPAGHRLGTDHQGLADI